MTQTKRPPRKPGQFNPQIVNGLQTSTQIARNIQTGANDNRTVMVKIVSSEDEETRDKIIKATNSQNPIQPATLRATDKVQRDIEDALKAAGLYYDRRKNFYKNEGKPADKIISISLMAQLVMTIVLGRPDSARARPSSLIKDDKVYSDVFSEQYPVALYTKLAALIRRVDRALRSRAELTPRDRTNLRFFTLFWLVATHVMKVDLKPHDVAGIELDAIEDRSIETAIDEVWKLYDGLGSSDQVAKGPELRRATMEAVEKRIASERRQGKDKEKK